MSKKTVRKKRVLTIGHSDHSLEAFLAILERSSVRMVADIRSNPASARFPWFERHALARELEKRGLAYRWFRSLGGRRGSTLGEQEHTALKEEADRRYAAFMNTPECHSYCEELIGLSASTVMSVFCAEREPEQCHRRLLSDKLMHMGARVVHILGFDESLEHAYHPDLEIVENRLIYRGRQLSLI